ncbi:MAG: hypothetical protein KC416_12765, partial [Myxococcales bacterium]|nr:hypothetical protein [Myxococcales bacterium]
WGRFRGVYDVDAHPNHEWRARVRYAPRHLSTNHFAYPGYWIWFIPLRNGLVSVGVVCEREKFPTEARTEAGFRAFLNQHRAVRELLERSEMLDFGSFKEISFSTKRFFSTDRWATVGDAGAFADPFYSPGSDFIAMENDFVTDLIRRDLESNSPSSWAPHLEAYERFMHQRFEQTMLLYRNQYRGLGSYNLMRIKLPFELAAYYNYAVRPYMLDRHLDLEWLARANELHAVIVKEFTEQEGLFEELAKSLSDRNLYFSRNTGEHRVGFDAVIPFALELGRPISDETFNDHRMQISGIAKKQTLRLLQRSPRRGAPVHSEA